MSAVDDPTQNPFAAPVVNPTDTADESLSKNGFAWEEKGLIVQRYRRTVWGVLTRPRPTFRLLKPTGNSGPASNFLAISLLIVAFAFWAWTGFSDFSISLGVVFLPAPVALAVASFIVLFFVYIVALAIHFALVITGGANQPFEATSKVCAYSFGSAALWNIVPYPVGVLISLEVLYIVVVGLAEVHRIAAWRSLIAVLLPIAPLALLFLG